MNMFRDLLILALVALGFGLVFSNPADWSWLSSFGPYISPYMVNAATFLGDAKPFSFVVCFALSMALFMTRLKY